MKRYILYIYIAQALRSTLCEKFMERENDDIISFIDTQSAKHSLANAKVSRDIKVQHFVRIIYNSILPALFHPYFMQSLLHPDT